MRIRFEVSQAEAFRRSVDAPKSIVTIEVDPSPKLSSEDRDLIAARLDGIDVCRLGVSVDKVEKLYCSNALMGQVHRQLGRSTPARIVASLPTFEALMEAIRANEREVQEALQNTLRTTF